MYYRAGLPISAPKDLIACRQFFLEATDPKQRQYEALRAYFVEGRSSPEVAGAFGYSVGSFRVLCHHFRRDTPEFFATSRHGPQTQPQKTAARDTIIALRKQNYSVYEISETLQDQGTRLSPTGVREVLKAEGFAPLPRRLDDTARGTRSLPCGNRTTRSMNISETLQDQGTRLSPTGVREVLKAEGFAPLPRRLDDERPARPRPFIEAVADVRAFSLAPRQFTTRCGGLFLFVPDLVRLPLEPIAKAARLPSSKMIPAAHALRASLALKLWSIERKRHVMAWVTDEGLALFSGLNVTPKKSYLSEYASRIDPRTLTQMLAAWHAAVAADQLFAGDSFNLDFHSVPYYVRIPAHRERPFRSNVNTDSDRW